MYESFYGFTEKPFNLTPDPKYLYLSGRHAEAFAHLEFGFQERGGFVVVTGEVGMGKTTLARYFLSQLEPGTATAVVLYPSVSAGELLETVLNELHVPSPRDTERGATKPYMDALHGYLLDARARAQRVVLVVDEAQGLTRDVLEQVRLISNLETDTEKLIQIVLIGQTELKEMLARRDLRQLAQRVTARYHLAPFDLADTSAYVKHRLAVAGGEGKVAFTTGALRAVQRRSGGIPRLINLVCDRALLAGYVGGTREIDRGMVDRSAQEVFGGAGPWMPKRALPWAVGAGAIALLAIAAYLWLPAGRLQARERLEATAATPAPVPSVPTPVPTPPLDAFLASAQREASWSGAVNSVRSAWTPGPPLRSLTMLSRLDQVRRLDVPAILELAPPDRETTCFVPLVALDGGSATLRLESGDLRVPLGVLERYWTGQTTFLWRDFDGVADDSTRSYPWASSALARLGRRGTGLLADDVANFQRDTALVADGIPGQRTLMALYSGLDYPRPRLGGARP
jgi:general secretion pathway protein A